MNIRAWWYRKSQGKRKRLRVQVWCIVAMEQLLEHRVAFSPQHNMPCATCTQNRTNTAVMPLPTRCSHESNDSREAVTMCAPCTAPDRVFCCSGCRPRSYIRKRNLPPRWVKPQNEIRRINPHDAEEQIRRNCSQWFSKPKGSSPNGIKSRKQTRGHRPNNMTALCCRNLAAPQAVLNAK